MATTQERVAEAPRSTEEEQKARRRKRNHIVTGVGTILVGLVAAGTTLGILKAKSDDTEVEGKVSTEEVGAPPAGSEVFELSSELFIPGQEALLEGEFPAVVIPNANDPHTLLNQLYTNRINSLRYAPYQPQSEAQLDFYWYNNTGVDTADPLYTADPPGYDEDGYVQFMTQFPETSFDLEIEVFDDDINPSDNTAARHILAFVNLKVDNGERVKEDKGLILFTLERRVDAYVDSEGNLKGQAVGFYVSSAELLQGASPNTGQTAEDVTTLEDAYAF